MKIKIAIAEDNNYLAASIKEKMGLFEEELEFVFRARNGKELIEFLSAKGAADVILMDIEMPVMNGIEAAGIVSRSFPSIKTIMLTVFDDEQKIFDAIMAGANGYLLKDETPDRILEGIKLILGGGAPMSPSIAVKALEILRNPGVINKSDTDEDFEISKRETEVLEYLSRGFDYNKIADALFISPATVRKHIENIYRKLQVNNKIQAVQKAMKHKLI